MIVHVSAPEDAGDFAGYVDRLLTGLGESNSSAARKTGVHVSLISKWRLGHTLPTIDRARQFADGMGVPRLVVMIKAGLLEPADVGLDSLYLDLAELDSMAAHVDESERRTLRAHVRLLVDGTRRRLEELQAARPKRRTRSAS
jgi:transcriptional regulator with XRE-family HTH domain